MYKCTATLPKFLFKAAKINISRDFRKNYIPRWSAESEKLCKDYTAYKTAEKGKQLLASLDDWMMPGVRDRSKRLKTLT